MRRIPCSLTLILMMMLGPAGVADDGTGSEEVEDSLTGKARAEVVELLGQPGKKRSRGDGEIWIYRLVRLGEGAAPPAGMRVVDLPGVGVVGKLERASSSAGQGAPTFEPTSIDSKGRATAGGPTRTQSAEATWNRESGKLESPAPPQPPEARPKGGRIKLELRLDAKGRVETWSVSPGK